METNITTTPTLTPQQKKFADSVLSGKSYQQSAIIAYNVGKEGSKNIPNSANSSAQEAMKRPAVIAYLKEHFTMHSVEAQTILATLMRDEDPRIQLTATATLLQRIDRLADLELRRKEAGSDETLLVNTIQYNCPNLCLKCGAGVEEDKDEDGNTIAKWNPHKYPAQFIIRDFKGNNLQPLTKKQSEYLQQAFDEINKDQNPDEKFKL